MSEPIRVHWQLIQGDDDMTAHGMWIDADQIRAWDEDFCLIEVTKRRSSAAFVGDLWEITNSDNPAWVDASLWPNGTVRLFGSPQQALDLLLGDTPWDDEER